MCVRAPVGITNITNREISIGRGLCALKPIEGNLHYFFYLLNCLRNTFIQKATGTTFLAISAETIKNIMIEIPPIQEQKRIALKIEELFSILDAIQKSLEA